MTAKNYGILSNHDQDFYRRFLFFTESKKLNKENVNELLEEFFQNNLSPHISDYVINISGLCSAVPSDIMSFMGDIYNRTEENGIEVNWKDNPNLKFAHLLYYEYGIEIFKELFDFLKRNGCRSWLSFRMNDCHYGSEKVSPLRSDFFYTAQNKGYMVGEKYGYWSTCLDFSYEEVRNYTLSYIKEQLMRYDTYGVEWDFMRELVCFDYLERNNCCEIMTAFLKELKAAVALAEEKWGHPLKINIRLGREPEECKIFGFDIDAIINEKLATSITVTPRFNITDSDMPIRRWKKLLAGTDIALYAGVEIMNYDFKANDETVVAAYSRKYLMQGADKIYLFNYFYSGDIIETSANKVKACSLAGSSAENALKTDNRFIVTYQDFGPLGRELYKPLPIKVSDGSVVEVLTAPYTKDKKVSIYIASDKNIGVEINGTCATPNDDTDSVYIKIPEKPWAMSYALFENTKIYRFDAVCDASDELQKLKFSLEGKANISYIEIVFKAE